MITAGFEFITPASVNAIRNTYAINLGLIFFDSFQYCLPGVPCFFGSLIAKPFS
jgi:hypothetical protein